MSKIRVPPPDLESFLGNQICARISLRVYCDKRTGYMHAGFASHHKYPIRNISPCIAQARRSQWPRGLGRRSSAARLLRLWVRIPPEAWMFVCCECCVLSGTGLCDELITRPKESYRLWHVVVCDQETSKTRRLKPATGL